MSHHIFPLPFPNPLDVILCSISFDISFFFFSIFNLSGLGLVHTNHTARLEFNLLGLRSSTPPGDGRSVYCVCTVTRGAQHINRIGKRKSSTAQIVAVRHQAIAVGTGFAFSRKNLLCARHCIAHEGTTEFFDVCVVKVPRPASQIRESDTIRMKVVADSVSEDWAVLERVAGTFEYWSAICLETDLPSPGDKIGIKDYPVGLTLSIPSATLSIASMDTRVHQYGNRKDIANQYGTEVPEGGIREDLVMDIVCDADYKEPEQAIQDVISVYDGRVRGSCGAPYFNVRGEVVAFHLYSSNDAPDDLSRSSDHSHQSHSQGHVLSRMPEFCQWRISHANLADPDYADGVPIKSVR